VWARRVFRQAGSLGMTIPKKLCEEVGIRPGTVLLVSLAFGNVIEVRKSWKGKEEESDERSGKKSV